MCERARVKEQRRQSGLKSGGGRESGRRNFRFQPKNVRFSGKMYNFQAKKFTFSLFTTTLLAVFSLSYKKRKKTLSNVLSVQNRL